MYRTLKIIQTLQLAVQGLLTLDQGVAIAR
jgi:hypothetical protein